MFEFKKTLPEGRPETTHPIDPNTKEVCYEEKLHADSHILENEGYKYSFFVDDEGLRHGAFHCIECRPGATYAVKEDARVWETKATYCHGKLEGPFEQTYVEEGSTDGYTISGSYSNGTFTGTKTETKDDCKYVSEYKGDHLVKESTYKHDILTASHEYKVPSKLAELRYKIGQKAQSTVASSVKSTVNQKINALSQQIKDRTR